MPTVTVKLTDAEYATLTTEADRRGSTVSGMLRDWLAALPSMPATTSSEGIEEARHAAAVKRIRSAILARNAEWAAQGQRGAYTAIAEAVGCHPSIVSAVVRKCVLSRNMVGPFCAELGIDGDA